MLPLIATNTDHEILPESVLNQVEKIFRDPLFSGSGILKKFLEFIVREKLEGKAHLVKEYTIAVDVLQKPKNFNPQENCIVRIHAARLRRVLAEYYAGRGAQDAIRILLPKGHYVPEFRDNRMGSSFSSADSKPESRRADADNERKLTIAVFPFHCSDRDDLSVSLSDGLGTGLSASLMNCKALSVFSYSFMRLMAEKMICAGEWQQIPESDFLVTGEIQRQKGKVRVSVQLVRSASGQLVWSHVYERTLSPASLFHVQDEITSLVFQALKKSGFLAGLRVKTVSIMAVA
jgi:TolB-like protein